MIDLTGRTFGDWEVLYFDSRCGSVTNRDNLWWCRCVCGTTRAVSGRNLRNGGSLGCGCTKKGLRLRPFEALYNCLWSVSRKLGRSTDITYDEFLGFVDIKHCHYCDDQITWSEFCVNKNGNHYNLDRKDNSLGYTTDNCVVCCTRCNRAKSNHFTYEEWVKIGALIRSWHGTDQKR